MAFENGFGNIADKAHDIAEVEKISRAIDEEQNKQIKLFDQIGRLYYNDMQGITDDNRYLPLFTDVIASLRLVEDYNKQIKDIKGLINCPNCSAEVPKDIPFCTFCGTKLKEDKPQVQEAEKTVCKNCGAVLLDGVVFCTNCGTKVEAPRELNPEVEKTPQQTSEQNTDVSLENKAEQVVSETKEETAFSEPSNETAVDSAPAEEVKSASAEQPVQPVYNEPVAKFCYYCGNKLNPQAKFCTACGQRLE